MIKNIVFDMGNVLLEYNPKKYMKTVTKNEAASAAVLRELFYGPEWTLLDAGTITEEEAVRRVSLRIPRYADCVKKAMDQWHSNLTPIAGMPELIKQLKEDDYKIFLLSNTSLRFYSYYNKLDMLRCFDGFVISAKERLLKPDPAIYKRLYSRFGLKSQECLFIDDLPQNIEGAKKVGFHAHLFCGAGDLQDYLKAENIF